MLFNHKKVEAARAELENHSLLTLNNLQTIYDLQKFMKVHSYAVWDFMSLLKSLQHELAPSGNLWLPTKGTRSELCRMINEIVMCEESDSVPGNGHMSHYDIYLSAMREIGANTKEVESFIDRVAEGNDPYTICPNSIARDFVKTTFEIIKQGPHCVAASFAYGRETVLPNVFKGLLGQLNFNSLDAPMFHYYLERHIEVDGDEHGPMSLKLIDYFTDSDPVKIREAEQAAIDSIESRIRMFDAIERLL